jgi:hypothetical protein
MVVLLHLPVVITLSIAACRIDIPPDEYRQGHSILPVI